METYFYNPQIANPQIFGLIPQSQISTFLRQPSPQIANPQIFMIYLKIANLHIYKKCCTTLSQNSPKSRFQTIVVLCTQFNQSIICYICEEKQYVFISRLAEALSPQITQKIRSANRKSPKCHICGRSANLRSCDLWNLFSNHSPLPISQGHISSANEQAFQQVQAPKIPAIKG